MTAHALPQVSLYWRIVVKHWLQRLYSPSESQGDGAMCEAREQREIEFWRTNAAERPESDSVFPIIDKVKDAEILLDLLERYRPLFRGRILELGCGQGWASCLLKRLLPDAHITATDISPFAVASNPKWAKVWGHSPDGLYACNSCETREADHSVDLVFAFSAAHHFTDHATTLGEIKRILRPGGTAVYFYEPVCSSLLYPLALKRVNNKRPEVHEDLIVPANFIAQAEAAGLRASFDYYPSTTKRGFVEMNYYKVLGWLPWLQRVLPATANIVIRA
jgi:SAM-dependent methyltransferase